MGDKIYMSQTKFDELSKKLIYMREVEFKTNRKTMSEAIDQGGGMHDNAGYEYAAAQESIILSKISELENILSNVQIIKNLEINTSAVSLGTKVKLLDIETDEVKDFVIVGAYETDLDKDHISYLTPIAKALIGKKVHEIAEIQLPKGNVNYEVLNIEKADIW